MKEYSISRLVKSEDLNHHGTLFAGRSAEWLIEAGFIAAASQHGRPEDIVCVNIHGFTFKKPVAKGDIITLQSKIVKTGRTSLTVHVKVISEISKQSRVDGFLTFVCVDEKTEKTIEHHLTLDETNDEQELELRRRAMELGR